MFKGTRRKSLVTEDFKRRSQIISTQLKQRDKDRVFVIDPRDSPLLSVWDGVTTFALMYTALLTPFEVSDVRVDPFHACWLLLLLLIAAASPSRRAPRSTLCPDPHSHFFQVGFLSASVRVDTWFVINRVLDAIFILDMALQFCVVVQVVGSNGPDDSTSSRDAAWVTERRKIARHYMLGWFPLDVLSILPSAFDFLPLFLAASDSESSGTDATATEKLSGFRAIRALRLVKLVRLIRASRLLKRWEARIGLSYSSTTLLKIISTMTLAAHWMACILALQATLHDDPMTTWLGHQQHCHHPSMVHVELTNLTATERFRVQCPEFEVGTFYLVAFSWSAMILTGFGEVGFYPSSDNTETVIVTALVVMGALMWAKVLATFCDLATNADPSAVEYRQALDDLNRFCRERAAATNFHPPSVSGPIGRQTQLSPLAEPFNHRCVL